MRRLSSDHSLLASHYDAVVIGSGYGGGIAASRLARMGYKVAVLERGREFGAGDFPDTLAEAQDEFQVTAAEGHTGRPTALFDVRVGADMHVVVGCGLGGTSLINANVSLPPDPRVWEDPVWPHELLEDQSLEEGYTRARKMLRPTPYPNEVKLDKLARMAQSAAALGAQVINPPLNITFKAQTNAANVDQPACTMCGDCCAGCNVGAKTTVDLTYIADAVNHGAQVFTEIKVGALEKNPAGGWRLFYAGAGGQKTLFANPNPSVTADIVVLGAGSLGSTEILMRAKAQGLAVSSRLGEAFSSNGDVLAFSYNNDQPSNAVGFGTHGSGLTHPPGPCIAGMIDLRQTPRLDDGMVIEEGVFPSALAKILPAMFSAISAVGGRDTDHGIVDNLEEGARRAESVVLGAYHGAMHNTQMFLIMAQDGAKGRLAIRNDRMGIVWPEAAKLPIFAAIGEKMYQATKATGGTYVPNPTQTTFLGQTVITTHPLGGCGLGRSAETGVVNHKCQVFDASPGAAPGAVHDGLFVTCGAAIPRALGVNPLLTISAIAERAMIHLAHDRDRTLSVAPNLKAIRRNAAASLFADATAGCTFTERMAGAFTGPNAALGALSFTATISVSDIKRFIADPDHTGSITGTAAASGLSAYPLDISDGVFNLMKPDAANPLTRRFEYVMRLTSREGNAYAFRGEKFVHNDHTINDLWADTTTLFVRFADLDAAGNPANLREAVLRITPTDFARQLQTIRGTGGRTVADRLEAVAAFSKVFAGTLADVYVPALMPLARFDMGRARKRRDLTTPTPEVHQFDTSDGLRLALTRYRGGTKGPLLFSHGLGVASSIFDTDTIPTNLAEYMAAAGYDCWLLDYRASIDLPYARRRVTADDIARIDYPAAVAEVLRLTGRPSLQVLAHCFGATTFTMAMLAGLQGVRSAVISQISTDVIVPFFPQRMLAFMRFPELLDRLGISIVDARAVTTDGFKERFVDALIRVAMPFRRGARTANATSNRITALYGQLYEIENLNRQTFEDGLPEMFGAASITAFKQLGHVARRQIVVDAAGADVYLPNVKNMAIPILFVHGEKNACFKPISTEKTVARLSAANGAALYSRHVVPGYGHIDCIFGKDAYRDVYPHMLAHLEKTAG